MLCHCSIQLPMTENVMAGSERPRLFVNLPSSSQAEDYLIDTRIIQSLPCTSLVSKETRTDPSRSDEGSTARHRYYIDPGCRGPQWCSDTHSFSMSTRNSTSRNSRAHVVLRYSCGFWSAESGRLLVSPPMELRDALGKEPQPTSCWTADHAISHLTPAPTPTQLWVVRL